MGSIDPTEIHAKLLEFIDPYWPIRVPYCIVSLLARIDQLEARIDQLEAPNDQLEYLY